MNVKVLAFGIAKDILGTSSITMELKASSLEEFKNLLEQEYPALKHLSSYMIAVNDEYATNSVTLSANDEIAIIPPVSGG